MRQKKDILIPAIMLAGFLILVWVQFLLFVNALKGREKDFNDKLFAVTFLEANTLRADSVLMQEMEADPVQFSKHRLKNILDELYRTNGIPQDYVLALGTLKQKGNSLTRHQPGFDSSIDSLIWQSDSLNEEGLKTTKLRMANLGPDPANRFFVKVFFPHKTRFLIYNLMPLIAVNVFTLLILFFCFIWVLRLYRKEAALARIRNDMINNLTHELKTPLFTVSVASKLLLEQEAVRSQDKTLSYAEKIHAETNRLNAMIDKVLKSAAMDNSKTVIAQERFHVHDCIRVVLQRMGNDLDELGIQPDLQLQATHDSIIGDAMQMETVFDNLLDNAIKYRAAKPEISIHSYNEEGRLVIVVKDNGIGMDAETRKHAFDRFYRGHTGDLHNVKGYGIGLNHVKSIIDAHGGTIQLKSERGSGSAFILRLPCL
jgi:signal transduction histidine kinase